MTKLTDEAVKALRDGATPGPWRADGPPYNRIVWSSNENRICFMAHTNGLDDARDNSTSNLVAAAPDLARALLDARAELAQARADAQAAVALVVERCAEVVPQGWCEPETSNTIMDVELGMAIQAVIRRLAPIDGLALVREMRAERDEAYVRGMAAGQQALAQIKGPLQVIDSPELHTLRAERDRLADANAVLEAKVAGLVEAAEDAEYDLLQWLECSKALTAAGFNMDGTAEVTAKLTAALSHIKRGKTNG